MQYDEFVELYEALSATTKKLEKTAILAEFLKKLEKKGKVNGFICLEAEFWQISIRGNLE